MSKCVENIHTKRVYDPPDQADGPRVLVDRLWPRGLRKESIALTLWLKEIAPSPELRRWFGHDPARWAEFGRRYRAELALNDEAVVRLTDLLKLGSVTLLYAAHDSAHNHALVLAAYLREYGFPCSKVRKATSDLTEHQYHQSSRPIPGSHFAAMFEG